MQSPEQIAVAIVDRFSWGSNVWRGGRLVGQQFIVAEAIAEAIKIERDRQVEETRQLRNQVDDLSSYAEACRKWMAKSPIPVKQG